MFHSLSLVEASAGHSMSKCSRSPTTSKHVSAWQNPCLLFDQYLVEYSVWNLPEIIFARIELFLHSKLLLPADSMWCCQRPTVWDKVLQRWKVCCLLSENPFPVRSDTLFNLMFKEFLCWWKVKETKWVAKSILETNISDLKKPRFS